MHIDEGLKVIEKFANTNIRAARGMLVRSLKADAVEGKESGIEF